MDAKELNKLLDVLNRYEKALEKIASKKGLLEGDSMAAIGGLAECCIEASSALVYGEMKKEKY
jgi:hypothetical protein